MSNILLIEPHYRNKYPPIALMKLSTYHKSLGDNVVFCKGKNKELREKKWDRIYITTVFTFHWKIVVNTIKYYKRSLKEHAKLYVGGAMATIMANELRQEESIKGIEILKGLLDRAGALDENNIIIDDLVLDYDIIDPSKNQYLSYEYPVKNAYFIHATRGCVRKCAFCAVPKIEPTFKGYCPIACRIKETTEKYGVKKDLMIMDNNILASDRLEDIIDEIIESGFGVDNNILPGTRKKRFIDFNQGLDARLIAENPKLIEILSRVAIKPIRIAFDHAEPEFVSIYRTAMDMAAQHNISNASNYILYNFNDTPADLYNRLKINIELNDKYEKMGLKTRIWSFPMRYAPLFGEHAKDRKYVGKNWTRKQIRGIQCILNATHGLVGPKHSYFDRAFGKTLEEFDRLLWMPEDYIIYRKQNEDNGNTGSWLNDFLGLSASELDEFKSIIGPNNFKNLYSNNCKVKNMFKYYIKGPKP